MTPTATRTATHSPTRHQVTSIDVARLAEVRIFSITGASKIAAMMGLQLQCDLPGGVGLYAFVGQSWAGDVAAQLFQRLAVVGAAPPAAEGDQLVVAAVAAAQAQEAVGEDAALQEGVELVPHELRQVGASLGLSLLDEGRGVLAAPGGTAWSVPGGDARSGPGRHPAPDGAAGRSLARWAADADDADFPATSRFIDLLFGKQGAFGYLKDFSAPLRFHVTDIDAPATAAALPEVRTLFDEGGLRISAVAGHHRDAPAVVYRIEHADKSITFSGDIDASGLPGLRRIAQGTSLLVFNSVVLDPPGSPEVLYSLHTPPKAIGEVADAVHAGQLLLSH